ncbi:hypothetical protein NEOLEDRAFT_842007 [Neolentinus lepideus HHB14362 ss-1]|uniref:Uncharacterized protein n=1 Tax=Neolentinus lepideus HHB14362 ss-1 TaxID=1314782 RepID=A0A165P4L2_9AGAM|nr:hypothetical protein NEOLEDRAFT_842007 [Neolentinus lepideus HHB14362 ss-1]
MRPRSTDTLYDIDGDVLDILRDNDVDFEIASASTVSNLPGPGRTLGKILGSSGRAVELVCNKIAGRVGRSPHAEMARLVRALLPARIGPCKERGHGFMCCSCAYRRVLDRVQSGQPDMIVVLDAIILLTMFDGDGATPQSTRALDKRCRKLLKHLRRDDLPSRNTAVYYVIALTTLLPRLARVFQKNGVQQLLTGIVNELSNREPLLYDESLLLARSRKALVSTLQSDALTVVKEYDQFEQIVEWKESLILERDPNHPERARLMNYMSVLVEKSLLADVEVSYVASLPVIRTFTTMNLWLSDLVQRDIVYLTDVFDGPRITQWLKVVASTRRSISCEWPSLDI